MIFVGKMMDYRQERCSLCSFNEDFYCHAHEINLDQIEDCNEFSETVHRHLLSLTNWYLCLDCNHSFREGDILKCEMRELDSDWCVLIMKECPIGKWRELDN